MPAPYDSKNMVPPKAPELNGGLYTGEAFAGPWGNVPVVPDVTELTTKTLLMQTHEPMGTLATQQFDPTVLRPGNNAPLAFPMGRYSSNANFACSTFPTEKRIALPRSADPSQHAVGSSWS